MSRVREYVCINLQHVCFVSECIRVIFITDVWVCECVCVSIKIPAPVPTSAPPHLTSHHINPYRPHPLQIRQLLRESYERSKKVLMTYRTELDLIAHGLIEYETLSGGSLRCISFHYNTVQCSYSVTPCSTILSNPIQSNPKECNTIQYNRRQLS